MRKVTKTQNVKLFLYCMAKKTDGMRGGAPSKGPLFVLMCFLLVKVSDYSSLSSEDADYNTETDSEANQAFLFSNVK